MQSRLAFTAVALSLVCCSLVFSPLSTPANSAEIPWNRLQEFLKKRADPAELRRFQYQTRLEAHLAAWQDWVNRTCHLTEGQLTQVSQLRTQLVAEELARYNPRQPRLAINTEMWDEIVLDTMPFLFPLCHSPGLKDGSLTHPQRLRNVLSEEQFAAISAAHSEREEYRRRAIHGYTVSLLGEELCFSVEQWEQVQRNPELVSVPADGVFFSHEPYCQIVPYRPLAETVTPALKALLRPEQMNRIRHWSTHQATHFGFGNPGGYCRQLELSLDQSLEELDPHLEAASRLRQEEASDQLLLDVCRLEVEGIITPEAVDEIRSGIAETADWVGQQFLAKLREKLVEVAGLPRERRPTGMIFKIAPIVPGTAFEEWRGRKCYQRYRQLTSLSSDQRSRRSKLSEQYSQFQRELLPAWRTAMLDSELWLSAEQRDAFGHVRLSLDFSSPGGRPRQARELLLLGEEFFSRYTSQQRLAVLRPAQTTIFAECGKSIRVVEESWDSSVRLRAYTYTNHTRQLLIGQRNDGEPIEFPLPTHDVFNPVKIEFANR